MALCRKSWLVAGSERGGDRAAIMYSLTVTAKLNDIDPQPPWLGDMTAPKVPALLPWNWRPAEHRQVA